MAAALRKSAADLASSNRGGRRFLGYGHRRQGVRQIDRRELMGVLTDEMRRTRSGGGVAVKSRVAVFG
jgi:hypothetical protein